MPAGGVLLFVWLLGYNDFSFTGESGIVYRGYLNTREGNQLVAIKTGKRKF